MRPIASPTSLPAFLLALALGLPAGANCGSPSCTHAGHEADHHAGHGADHAEAPSEHALFGPYEAIRQSLIADSVEGVAQHAKELAAGAAQLADQAGSDDERALMREIADASKALAAATGLEPTRDAFYAVSKPLVRYRELAEGDKPIVVYCSMAKKSWLQPAGPIGNPYYGSSMLRCGSVVSQ